MWTMGVEVPSVCTKGLGVPGVWNGGVGCTKCGDLGDEYTLCVDYVV